MPIFKNPNMHALHAAFRTSQVGSLTRWMHCPPLHLPNTQIRDALARHWRHSSFGLQASAEIENALLQTKQTKRARKNIDQFLIFSSHTIYACLIIHIRL
jgi:hypothetical protein